MSRSQDLLRSLTRFELKNVVLSLSNDLAKASARDIGKPKAAYETVSQIELAESILEKVVLQVTRRNRLKTAPDGGFGLNGGVGTDRESGEDGSLHREGVLPHVLEADHPKKKKPRHDSNLKSETIEGGKAVDASITDEATWPGKSEKKTKRDFCMDAFNQRHIALHIAYFGEQYQGFASQGNQTNTVEHHLFEALKKTRLIVDPKTANFSRSGRTDARVSASGQIVTLTVRSSQEDPLPKESIIPASLIRNKAEGTSKPAPQKSPSSLQDSITQELNYPRLLNRQLPNDIFVLGWAPAPSLEYKARFNAESRTYRYYFCKRGLDLSRMRSACDYFLGEHDFRNFCKMDVMNVCNFVRKINSIKVIQETDLNTREAMCYFEIVGTAFLWHQIRCMVAVLFMVGRHDEDPSIVSKLLDVKQCPAKPTYDMAPPEPLVLFDCEYSAIDLPFLYDSEALKVVRREMEWRMAKHEIASKITAGVISRLDSRAGFGENGQASLPGSSLTLLPSDLVDGDFDTKQNFRRVSPHHRPLLERPTCPSFKEKLQSLSKKKVDEIEALHGWKVSDLLKS